MTETQTGFTESTGSPAAECFAARSNSEERETMQFFGLPRSSSLRAPGFFLIIIVGWLCAGGCPASAQSRPVQSATAKSASKSVAARQARNIILFLADAGGIPALHAASLVAYQKPNGLFIHTAPHVALSDTSAADVWVTDSAAGMSAIVTGQKTNNGVISMSADAVRGKSDGEELKTILEYAEERGLSTGVVSNVVVTDATGAACFSHVNDRKNLPAIFSQFLNPAFGDGVDVLAGPGRPQITAAITPLGMDLESALKGKGYFYTSSPDGIPADARRVAALFDSLDYDQPSVVRRAIDILSRNPKGFFLMVECDMHTDKLKLGLDHALVMDGMVREAVGRMGDDTMVLFTADHSFDIRVRAGKRGDPLLPASPDAGSAPDSKPAIRVDDGHSGEQVLVAAWGPGAERVRGFIENKDLFGIMMAAYGWKPDAPGTSPPTNP